MAYISGIIAAVSVILAFVARLFFADKALFGLGALSYLRVTNTMLLFTIAFMIFKFDGIKKIPLTVYKYIHENFFYLVTTIILSFFAAWIFWQYTLTLVPNISIGKYITQNDKYYMISVMNEGSRDAIDVTINADLLSYLKINNKYRFFRNKQRADSNNVESIPLSIRRKFACIPHKRSIFSKEYEKNIKFTTNDTDFIYYIKTLIDSSRSEVTQEFYRKVNKQEVSFKDLFFFFDTLRVIVLARDETSQHSKIFTKKFTANDINKGEKP